MVLNKQQIKNKMPLDPLYTTFDYSSEMALQVEPLIAEKAKERQLSNLKQFADVANLPHRDEGKTRDELSELSGISARNISKVKNIISTGSDELIETVCAGNIFLRKKKALREKNPKCLIYW